MFHGSLLRCHLRVIKFVIVQNCCCVLSVRWGLLIVLIMFLTVCIYKSDSVWFMLKTDSMFIPVFTDEAFEAKFNFLTAVKFLSMYC